ncbi:MAG: hypothetical protein WB660_12230, partial [Candidatus Sulfotelmatobacter sp.]
KRHNLLGPQGMRGRNSDNNRLRQVLGWDPFISLRQGLPPTYSWIENQLGKARPIARSVSEYSTVNR